MKSALSALVLALAATGALAESPAAAGPTTTQPTSVLSREQVRHEFQAFRVHPVFLDGTVMIQGDAGYVPANQGTTADRQPSVPHTHVLGSTGAPAAIVAPMTQAERRAYQEQYIN